MLGGSGFRISDEPRHQSGPVCAGPDSSFSRLLDANEFRFIRSRRCGFGCILLPSVFSQKLPVDGLNVEALAAHNL